MWQTNQDLIIPNASLFFNPTIYMLIILQLHQVAQITFYLRPNISHLFNCINDFLYISINVVFINKIKAIDRLFISCERSVVVFLKNNLHIEIYFVLLMYICYCFYWKLLLRWQTKHTNKTVSLYNNKALFSGAFFQTGGHLLSSWELISKVTTIFTTFVWVNALDNKWKCI